MTRPPFDPQFAADFVSLCETLPKEYTVETIIGMRPLMQGSAERATAGFKVTHEEYQVAASDGTDRMLTLSVFRPSAETSKSKRQGCFYHIHGGGMTCGDRFTGVAGILEIVKKVDVVVTSIEYGLAPEYQGLSLINDCYAGLKYVHDHAAELGIDASKILIGGGSAGGGLSAGTTLMCRDNPEGAQIFAQLLIFPMLDDRCDTPSAEQFESLGVCNTKCLPPSWACYLGDMQKTGEIHPYCAPARATDLTGLPPAYISVGTCEPFRDEDIAYASRLMAAGVSTELHVFAGSTHCSTTSAPDAKVSQLEREAPSNWVQRMFTPGPPVAFSFGM